MRWLGTTPHEAEAHRVAGGYRNLDRCRRRIPARRAGPESEVGLRAAGEVDAEERVAACVRDARAGRVAYEGSAGVDLSEKDMHAPQRLLVRPAEAVAIGIDPGKGDG